MQKSAFLLFLPYEGVRMDRELFEKRKKLICELIQDDLYVGMKEKELAAFMQVSKAERE